MPRRGLVNYCDRADSSVTLMSLRVFRWKQRKFKSAPIRATLHPETIEVSTEGKSGSTPLPSQKGK